jgi:hypothetical protein
LTITTTNKSTELAVVGEGKVEAVPDIAYVDLGITTNNSPTTDEAQKTINKTNNQIVEAMKKLGISKGDIKTTNYSIYPDHKYEGGQNYINGYNGNVTIQVKVHNPQLVAKVIEDATKAGANNIQGSRFAVEKPEKYREQAREAAIKNAKEQGEKMAKNLGIWLGKVVNIVESQPIQSSPVYYRAAAEGLGGAGDGANIESGSQTITSIVTLYFEKK